MKQVRKCKYCGKEFFASEATRGRARGKERNAEILLRGVSDESEGSQKEAAAGFYECRGASD